MKPEKQWYIVHTRAGDELKTHHALNKKQIECFCPLLNTSLIKKKSKSAEKLLLPQYIYVHILPEKQETVKKINGVKNFMYWLGSYAVVLEEDILFLKELIKKYQILKAETIEVDISRHITIENDNKYGEEDLMIVSFHAYGFAVVVKESKINVRIINTNSNKNQSSAIRSSYTKNV